MASEQRVNLRVGSVSYTTTTTTLCSDPESMLAHMVQQPNEKAKLARGEELFIDRNGKLFEYILNYLRDGEKVVLPADSEVLKNVAIEADFFLLSKLARIIRRGGVFAVGDIVTVRPCGVRFLSQFPPPMRGSNTNKYTCWLCQEQFELKQTVSFVSAEKHYETDCFWGKIISITDTCAIVSFAVAMIEQFDQQSRWSVNNATIKIHMPTAMLSKY